MKLVEILANVPLILLMWVMPGILLSAVIFRRHAVSAMWHQVMSIAFYLTLYLLLDVVPVHGFRGTLPDMVFSVVFAATLIALAILAHRRSFGWTELRRTLSRRAYVLYFTFTMICTAVPFRNVEQIRHISFITVAHLHTFWIKPAHDNGFQYWNALAMAHYEPFDKYYGGGKLTYQVQDREILPGVVYSVFMRVIGGVAPHMKDLYLLYNIFGICLNAAALLAVMEFVPLLFPSLSATTMAVLVGGTSFALMNSFYTWFKLAGGALTLYGILLVLRRPRSWTAWAGAGLFWGLAANMHGSAALFFPFGALFLLAAAGRGWVAGPTGADGSTSLGWPRAAGRALLLTGVVVALYLPWALVKKAYFVDTDVMLRQYLTDTYRAPGPYTNLLDQYLQFLRATPLTDLVSRRLCQYYYLAHVDPVRHLVDVALTEPFQRFIIFWNRKEIVHPSFFFLPQLLGGLTSILAGLIRRRAGTTAALPRSFAVKLLALAALSVAGLLSLSYYPVGYPADTLWHQPMVVVLLAMIAANGLLMTSRHRSVRIVFVLAWAVCLGKYALGIMYYGVTAPYVIEDPYWEHERCPLD